MMCHNEKTGLGLDKVKGIGSQGWVRLKIEKIVPASPSALIICSRMSIVL
jgi:hypothetical protein